MNEVLVCLGGGEGPERPIFELASLVSPVWYVLAA